MSDRVEVFDVDDAPAIEVSSNAGDIVIKKGDAGRVKIALSGPREAVDDVVVEASADIVSVRSKPAKARFFTKRVDIVITVPPGGTLKVDVGSGAVRVRLPMAEVAISAGSGDIRVDKPVGELTIKVGSGDIYVGTVDYQTTIASANGDIRVRNAYDIRCDTASGDVRLGEVSGVGRIKSASGDIVVGRFGGSELEIKTMSGDSRIGIVPGMEVKARIKTLSGDFRNKITKSDQPRVGSMALDVKSFSGDVTLKTASPLSEAPPEPPVAPHPPESPEPLTDR